MIKFNDYIFEKELDPEKLSNIKNDVYWIDDAIIGIIGIFEQITILSGLLGSDSFVKEINNIIRNKVDNRSLSKQLILLIDEILDKPSSEWKKNGKTITPQAIVYKLKEALENLKNALFIINKADRLNQEQIQRIKGTRSYKANLFNAYLDNAKVKTNEIFTLFTGVGERSNYQTRTESLYVGYQSLDTRVSNLLIVVKPILDSKGINKKQEEELEKLIENLGSITKNIDEKLKKIKRGERINVSEFQDYLKTQTNYFNEWKDDFFDSFKEIMVVDNRGVKVGEYIDNAQENLKEVSRIIGRDENAKKMFVGINREDPIYQRLKHLDGAAENASQAALDALNRRREGNRNTNKGEENKTEPQFNKKTIKIDNQIRQIFNIKSSKKQTEIEDNSLKKIWESN